MQGENLAAMPDTSPFSFRKQPEHGLLIFVGFLRRKETFR